MRLKAIYEIKTKIENTIICPGYGWIGNKGKLNKYGGCPDCKYENGRKPERLLTLGEILERLDYETECDNVDIQLSVLDVMGIDFKTIF